MWEAAAMAANLIGCGNIALQGKDVSHSGYSKSN